MIKRFLTGQWFVVIAPPSMFLTRSMTFRECFNFINSMPSARGYIIVRDISGKFRKRYVKKTYPITNPFDL